MNEWTIDGCSALDAGRLLRRIDMGYQTFGTDEDGVNGWGVACALMWEYVKMRHNPLKDEDDE